jgi:hypothetical protein
MAGTSRQHRGEKRRKELARKARQEEKRQRRAEKKGTGEGSGPPIDWEAGETGVPPPGDAGSGTNPGDPQDGNPS